MDKIREKLVALQLQVNESESRCSTVEQARSEARTRYDNAQSEKESIQRRIALLKVEQEKRKKQLEKTQSKLSSMELVLNENEAIITEVKTQNEILRIEELEDKILHGRKYITKKQTDLEDKTRRKTMLLQRLKSTMDKLNKKEENVSALEQEKVYYKDRINEIFAIEKASNKRQDDLVEQTVILSKELNEAEIIERNKKANVQLLERKQLKTEKDIQDVINEREKLEELLNGYSEDL